MMKLSLWLSAFTLMASLKFTWMSLRLMKLTVPMGDVEPSTFGPLTSWVISMAGVSKVNS